MGPIDGASAPNVSVVWDQPMKCVHILPLTHAVPLAMNGVMTMLLQTTSHLSRSVPRLPLWRWWGSAVPV